MSFNPRQALESNGLNIFDRQNIVGAIAARSVNNRFVALKLTDERTRDGAGNGHQIALDIPLVIADDLVSHHFTGVLIFKFHSGAKHNSTARVQLFGINHLQGGQLTLKLGNAPLDVTLQFFGRVIFSVFSLSLVTPNFFAMLSIVSNGRTV